MRRYFGLFFLFLNTFFLHAQNKTLTFMPHWIPQAQFAGYYMALEKGFYTEMGLKVNIIHPNTSRIATESLKNKEVDVISLFLVSALTAQDKGVPLVNIAQISQNSALMIVAKKSKNFKSIKDLQNKRIGIWKSGFDEIPKALIAANHLNVTWVPILSSINMFIEDGIDAMTVMSYNEYDQIINAGFNPDELTIFRFSELGFNIVEDGLYCLDSTRQARGLDLEKFVQATLKGWAYAEQHREETIQVVLEWMKKEHVATNYAHQKWMLDQMFLLMKSPSTNIKNGQLSEADFNNAQQILFHSGVLKNKLMFPMFYKPVIKK
jgi:NitT/TauT family transport system substrate-binding protein